MGTGGDAVKLVLRDAIWWWEICKKSGRSFEMVVIDAKWWQKGKGEVDDKETTHIPKAHHRPTPMVFRSHHEARCSTMTLICLGLVEVTTGSVRQPSRKREVSSTAGIEDDV